jgi:hypothetical protein
MGEAHDDDPVVGWQRSVTNLVEGRDVVLAGAPLAGYTPRVERLRSLGARRLLCIANGIGTGDVPTGDDVGAVVLDLEATDMIDEFRQWERLMANPPPIVVDALDSFDPRGEALVLIAAFQACERLGTRPGFGARRAEWVALEDKTVCDALFDRAGVVHPACAVVAPHPDALVGAAAELDNGDGTVWAGDASRGFNGGGEYVRWVRSADDVGEAVAFFASHCDHVRVAPFVEGIPSSVHGFATADGVAVFRPVELVTLRPPSGNRFRYAGAATFWDPSRADREVMRAAVRRVGEVLRAEIGFRGMFTVDGILGRNGWVPTELNPRAGAALGYAAIACPAAHLDLLHHLVIEGDARVRAADLEAVILPAADATRWGGGWTTVPQQWDDTVRVEVVREVEGAGFSAARFGDTPEATIMRGPSAVGGFVRVEFDAARVRAGPSIAPMVVDAFAFADRTFEAGIGALSPPRSVR